MSMNRKSFPPRCPLGFSLIAAVSSIAIGIALLGAVAGLFLSEGMPFEHVIVAERTCAGYAFVSQRDICMRSVLAPSHLRTVASR
jgi:hypothetical protein